MRLDGLQARLDDFGVQVASRLGRLPDQVPVNADAVAEDNVQRPQRGTNDVKARKGAPGITIWCLAPRAGYTPVSDSERDRRISRARNRACYRKSNCAAHGATNHSADNEDSCRRLCRRRTGHELYPDA